MGSEARWIRVIIKEVVIRTYPHSRMERAWWARVYHSPTYLTRQPTLSATQSCPTWEKTRSPMPRWEGPMSRLAMPPMSESREAVCYLLKVACPALSIVNRPQILTQVANHRIVVPMAVTHSILITTTTTTTSKNLIERMIMGPRITN